MCAAPAHGGCPVKLPNGQWDFNHSANAPVDTVETEFARSMLVVVGKVLSERHLQEDRSDPERDSTTEYRIQPITTFKGSHLPEFTIYDPNDSGGFRPWVGRTYLLFVTSSEKGRSRINSCGWSDELANAGDTVAKVKALAAVRH
jgi:hypothetical protein